MNQLLACLVGLLSLACVAPNSSLPAPIREASASTGVGDEIVICGQRYHTGAPVVLWTDPGGYDAYQTSFRNGKKPVDADEKTGRRYTPGRRGKVVVPADCTDVNTLAQVVDQFVLHYDVCGTSRTCFRVLQHGRGLSVHFMLDIDGTIYQSLDLRERAWHASQANTRSVGVEIAQMGARRRADLGQLDEWYEPEGNRTRLTLPARHGDGGVRTPAFVGYTARPDLIEGGINGGHYLQYDFTPEQYDSLVRLIATLTRVLPRIELEVPRAPDGSVLDRALTELEFEAYSGLLGHYHVTTRKIDPGPAFDWQHLLDSVRRVRR